MKFMKITESILDKPQMCLCPAVWERIGLNQYKIKQLVKEKLLYILEQVKSRFGLTDVIPVLVGSITSNSYSSDSDIDMHIWIQNFEDDVIEQMNDDLKVYVREISEQNPDMFQIDGYRIELYFRKNIYHDFASVGCYDIINERWIVEPEIKDANYDPYSDYYDDGSKVMVDIIGDIRQIILEIYEQCLLYFYTSDDEFRTRINTTIVGLLTKAKDLRDKSREKRNTPFEPLNKDQALQLKYDRQKNVNDAAYKMLDKFGYVEILRDIRSIQRKLENNEMTFSNGVMEILKTIDNNLGTKNINEEDNTEENNRYSVQFMG